MEALQSRVDSFKPRRIKHGSKSITFKWPHGEQFAANPQSLAEAGFYYDPSPDDKDAVKCFMCGKMLSDWEEDDDPFEIHWTKCAKSCAWAVVRCGLREDIGADGSFEFGDKSRLPNSKAMEKARLATFTSGEWWPHDGDHGAAPLKMAQAGFVYTPQFANDDLATCLYCKVSLSGWDEDDDPLEEHRKRDRKTGSSCPFFATVEPSKPARKPPSKASSSKSHKSKAPSRSETVELFEDEDAANDERPAVMKGAKTPRKPRGAAASTAKAPRTVTRSKSKPVIVEEVDEDEEEVVPIAKLPPTKSSKSRSKTKEIYEDVEEEVVDDHSERKPRSTQRRKSSRTRSKSRAPTDEEIEVEPPKKQKKTAAKADINASDSEYLSVAESSRALPSRSTSKPRAAAPSPDHVDVDDPPQRRQPSRPPPSHSRKPSRSQSKASINPDPDPVDEPQLPPSSRPAPNHSRKPSRSQSKAKASSVPPAEETSVPPKVKKSTRTKAGVLPVDGQVEDAPISSKPSKGKSKAKVAESKLPEPKLVPSEEPEEYHDAMDDVEDRMDVVEDQLTGEPSDDHESQALTTVPAPKSPTKTPSPLPKDEGRPPLSSDPSETSRVQTQEIKIGPPISATRKQPAPQRPPASSSSNISRATSQVVDILTDEEDALPSQDRQPSQAPAASSVTSTSLPKPAQKMLVEVVVPTKPLQRKVERDGPPVEAGQGVDDMDIQVDPSPKSPPPHEPEEVPALQTPPRPTPQLPKRDVDNTTVAPTIPLSPEPQVADACLPPLPAFHPPLSTLPFQQVDQLTEAELDMTVEEWIRFQMKIEYEKFKRDGEREIGRFRERAEEIRRAIAAL